ncbi:ABC transporter substrate-binding protein [Nocardia vaccinii]|uniref:ABC transporter substrate-binding protein n=1 Tax=Nocardia vaccinii TaxID=1822 RepID=UPI00082D547B|nr:ABC transporter substrate-binding protein [Nocardia vaccinii]
MNRWRQRLRRLAELFWPPITPPPRPPRKWVPLGVTVVIIAVVAPAAVYAPQIEQVFTCGRGWQTSTPTWHAGNQCVGLSAGPYNFGVPGFAPVMRLIRQQNDNAATNCPQGAPVTIGVLLSLTDTSVGERALDELEGMAAAQQHANDSGCHHPVRLLIGQLGDDQHGPGPREVARAIAARGDVVAVAGVGLSYETTTEVVETLAAAKIPMVGDVVTAEGFDQDGSRADQPIYDSCDDAQQNYRNGLGRDYFYRVAFRVAVQIDSLTKVAASAPDFVMVPTGTTDPYTCTALPLLHRAFHTDAPDVKFDADEPTTVVQTAERVCAATTDVTVAYLARGRDLSRFLFSIDQRYGNGLCTAPSITVIATSDAVRLSAPEPDPVLEDLRSKALSSASFTSGRVRLLSSMIADTHRPADDTAFLEYQNAFTAARLDRSHLDQGWAVNGYDAVTTIADAVQTLPQHEPVTSGQVNAVISGYNAPGHDVPGAGGPIYFDNAGNRAGPVPAVVRVCPIEHGPDRASHAVRTEPVQPGRPYPAC